MKTIAQAFANCFLTVLSFGGGQDSFAILCKLIYDPEFFAEHVKGDLVVVMSDTGNEHPHTYDFLAIVKKLCTAKGIEFHLLHETMGFHTPAWMNLVQAMIRKTMIVMIGTKTCTENLKIAPIYKFLNLWMAEKYGLKAGQKGAIKNFVKQGGTINMMIGIAKGEETRLLTKKARAAVNKRNKYMESVNFVYPLVDQRVVKWLDDDKPLNSFFEMLKKIKSDLAGMNRQDCQRYIKACGQPVPFPSNCMFCPWMSMQELIWLFRFLPKSFEEWCGIERKKIEKNAPEIARKNNLRQPIFDSVLANIETQVKVGFITPKGATRRRKKLRADKKLKAIVNCGVFGSVLTIEQRLDEALEKFGHLSDEYLIDYKMNHGCVRSKY